MVVGGGVVVVGGGVVVVGGGVVVVGGGVVVVVPVKLLGSHTTPASSKWRQSLSPRSFARQSNILLSCPVQ